MRLFGLTPAGVMTIVTAMTSDDAPPPPPGTPLPPMYLQMPTRTEQKPCWNCYWSIRDQKQIRDELARLKITAASSGAPGENTIAREFRWGPIIIRLEDLTICRIPERSGCPVVCKASSCSHWREDSGRIWVPVSLPPGMSGIGGNQP